MISKFKKILDDKHSGIIQGRVVSIAEAKHICEIFNNLTEPHNNTFINMPIEKIIEFSSTSKAKKRSGIEDYIAKVQEEKIQDAPKVQPITEIVDEPIVESVIESEPIITEAKPVIVQKKVVEPIKIVEDFSKVKETFYQKLLEQLDELRNKNASSDITIDSMESRISSLSTINESMINTFEKISNYIEQSNSSSVIKEMHESIISNQKTISEHHQTLFENQNALINNQLLLIESQKLVTESIQGLIEKISLITSNQQPSNPIININENTRQVVKVVERNKDGLITKIIENSSVDAAVE